MTEPKSLEGALEPVRQVVAENRAPHDVDDPGQRVVQQTNRFVEGKFTAGPGFRSSSLKSER